jgi:hypothetical protein
MKKDINISQNVAAAATVEYFNFKVPPRSLLRILKFGNYINVRDAWGSITWRILNNGIGVHPYDVIKDQLGYGAEPREIICPEFQGGDVLSINVTNDYADEVGIGIALQYELIGE